MDQLVLRNNADQKSWEVNTGGKYQQWADQVQADEYRYAGKQAKRAGNQQAFNTLLATAGATAKSLAGMPSGVGSSSSGAPTGGGE